MREAGQADIKPLAAFLTRHIETSMFLLGNLEAHGLGNTAHRHATRYVLREVSGQITGVFGRTNDGFAMVQMPDLTEAESHICAGHLRGQRFLGITGESHQVARLTAAVPLAPEAWQLQRDEPLFRRAMQPGPAPDLRAASDGDLPLLTGWFTQYLIETGLHGKGAAPDHAPVAARRAVHSGTLRLLLADGAPVAMGLFNAETRTAVQLGGVFVPPALRGRGHAGTLVRQMLAERARLGPRTAILFAATPAAQKAYTRIGFDPIGSYRVAVTRTPEVLPA